MAVRHLKTFREMYCEEFGISSEEFEEEVLWQCFYPHAVEMGRMFWQLRPRYFDGDFELIREVAECTSVSEIRAELNDFRYHRPITGFWRKSMRIRISGQRLVDLASKLLPHGHHG